MKVFFEKIKSIGKFLAHPTIFFYSLIILMILVVVGTIAQRYIGLYQAQKIYFSSFFFWLGPIPLPSGYTILTIIFSGLLSHLIFNTKFKKEKIGIIITHLGALLLLFGGFLTAFYSYEGNLTLEEGETSQFIADYYKRELAIIEMSLENKNKVITFAEGWLKGGKILKHNNLPFVLKIINFFPNSDLTKRENKEIYNFKGIAQNYKLLRLKKHTDLEKNRNGALIQIDFKNKNRKDEFFVLLEGMTTQEVININDKMYYLEIRRAQTKLPFKVHLKDFSKKVYAGTNMAKSYESQVSIIDDNIKQDSLIKMNNPLRYKGYTLYQSSYIEDKNKQISIFAVVYNVGRLFPYISSIIMCLGMLIHLLIQVPKLLLKP